MVFQTYFQKWGRGWSTGDLRAATGKAALTSQETPLWLLRVLSPKPSLPISSSPSQRPEGAIKAERGG